MVIVWPTPNAMLLKERGWDLLCYRIDQFICDETNNPLSLGMWEAMWISVLHTVIDVFQVGVFLDIDAYPPAVQ
jgi:hypothetical protein